ncbi:DUF3795 domain-containing protein [Gudongella sp. DL1XJH-153]|uniref:DUF3795 domain-containing protein n=1 Tax=Gudongella sp. DL1XJH-153 TaxID=3409804 RepID=UPI003BB6189C
MKNFTRSNLTLSLCGLNCSLCPMKIGAYCPGCGGGEGNQSCSIAKCSLEHERIEYCYLCPEFPCSHYEGAEEYDSFITHQRQLRDLERAQIIGIEAYNTELFKKREILDLLLSEFNDGRRKTFFCIAVNLFDIADLETIMEQLVKYKSKDSFYLKQKSEKAVELLNRLAIEEGVELKLRKKPSGAK